MAADRQSFWFGVAWTLLVVTVAVGFFIQSQTINDLEDTQAALRSNIERQAEFVRDLRSGLCDLMLTIAEEIKEPTGIDLTKEIQHSFELVGIECRPTVNP
jgi:hypothetical protein